MRLPNIQPSPRATVTVPRLCGGLNLWDQPEQVGDNQLTACNNVWWHDGALQTRPGLRKTVTFTDDYNICRSLNERELLLTSYHDYIDEGEDVNKLYGTLIRSDGTVQPLGDVKNCWEQFYEDGCALGIRTNRAKTNGYDWVWHTCSGGYRNEAIGYNEEQKRWDTVELYVPLLMMNGKGNKSTTEGKSTMVEAVNLLTQSCRCTYTTDGVSDRYDLPLPMVYDKTTVTLTLYDEAAVTRTVSMWGYSAFFEQPYAPQLLGLDAAKYSSVRLKVILSNNAVHFEAYGTPVGGGTETKIDGFVLPAVDGERGNNLDVTTGLNGKRFYGNINAEPSWTMLSRMTKAVWYGGGRSGLDTGAHLFVTGNEQFPNLLHWSDVNNPLYFPENNYAYVGEDSSPITALAKQGELLVIFREHDIYCVQYVAGEVPTAQQLEDGEVIETTVHKSYFPITQLHPNIGCDCPDTVRLVNNKLVWLTSDGRVHILTAASQYSERNVRQASPLIEQALRSHTKAELQAALAGEYEGYYVLLVGNKLYLMDCQTAAFTSFQYYSREETAQKALPWYVWTLPPHVYSGLVYDGEGLTLVAEDGEGCSALYTFGGDSDDGEPIESSFTTKLFRFEEGNSRMSIGRLQLCVGDAAGCRITVQYVTEQGTTEDGYLLECDGGHHGALRRYPLTPHLRMVDCFGLTLTARQPMTVAGLQINYKKQGVVR